MSVAPSYRPQPLAKRTAEPLARGIVFHAFREAILTQWGQAGIASAARHLTASSSEALTTGVLALEWRSEQLLMDWHEALWLGPLREDERELRAFVDRNVSLGFGRTRRALLRLVTPLMLARKAAELWRHDHTHGEITIERFDDSPTFIQGKLLRHPYLESKVTRAALAETFRSIITITGVKNARAHHFLEGRDVLTVKLTWDR